MLYNYNFSNDNDCAVFVLHNELCMQVQKFMPIHAYVQYLHANWNPLVRLLWRQILSISPKEVCAYLKEQIPFISVGILERFLEHKFDGEVFLQLNYE